MKIRISAIALVLALTAFGVGQAFASFPDTVNHQYSTAIDWIQADGIVGGYPDGTYKPDQTINRAEFTKIITEATIGGTKTGSNCFSDVTNEWFAPYVCTAKDYGIVGGNGDGTFAPAREVNYAEALKIVLEAYNTEFPRTYYEYWYSKYVEYALDHGLSFAGNKLPHSFVSRAEMAEMIYWINNPQPDVSPTPAPTAPTTFGQPSTIGSPCTTTADCAPYAYYPSYCVGTYIAIPICQLGVCIDGHQVDCADPTNGTTACRDTATGGECY